jgi:hypothetical protein
MQVMIGRNPRLAKRVVREFLKVLDRYIAS